MRYLSLYPDFCGHVVKMSDKKAEINFKIYDVKDWIATNYNIHIAQYRKKLRQPDNEIWSVNKIKLEK